MSDATRILSDDAILEKRDRDAFGAGFKAGVELAIEILDSWSDVEDDPNGQPVANWAMRAQQEIKAGSNIGL
jgi:hypothetical protein